MTQEQAIEVLKQHQKWRMGEESAFETKPGVLSEAIYTIIKSYESTHKDAWNEAIRASAESAKTGMEYDQENITFHSIVDKESILKLLK